MTAPAPRFTKGQVVAYATILYIHDASNAQNVRYRVYAPCCEELYTKSHRSLQKAIAQAWTTCPTCRRSAAMKHRARLAQMEDEAWNPDAPKQPEPQVISPTPVVLPVWMKKCLTHWVKPPSVVPQVWGQAF